MTLEEFKEKHHRLTMEEISIREQKGKLETQYIQSLPIKTGDRFQYQECEGWVISVQLSYRPEYIDITYNPPKKNGERSGLRRVTYSVNPFDKQLKIDRQDKE